MASSILQHSYPSPPTQIIYDTPTEYRPYPQPTEKKPHLRVQIPSEESIETQELPVRKLSTCFFVCELTNCLILGPK